jgi:ankyrin repeat protein
MIPLLIAAGATVDATNFNNATPLLIAVANSRVDAVRMLLEHKADPNHKGIISNWAPPGYPGRSDWNFQPIFFAVASRNDDFMKLLLDAGANPDGTSDAGSTPLTFAIGYNYVDGVRLLLEHGANPNAIPDKAESPLNETLSQNRDHQIIKLLLDNGANPNVTNRNGYVPLFQTSDTNIIRWLVEHKADVNTRNAAGLTPLMCGQIPADKLEILLSHGANPDLQDTNGNAALHHIVRAGCADCVKVLLEHKANPNIQNNLGNTPLDIAKSGLGGMISDSMLTPDPSGGRGTVGVNQEQEIVDLLTKAGGLADLPKRDRIEATRASYSSVPVFYKGSHDWNRYSLLELVAREYGLLSISKSGQWITGRRDSEAVLWRDYGGYAFPDFGKVVIYRRARNSTKQTATPVNLEDILKTGDCSRDVWLEWGDVVEIPEADHPVDQRWEGLTESTVNALSKCVARQVTLKIKGESETLKLAPQLTIPYGGSPFPDFRLTSASFMLRSVLDNSKLIRVSSDLAHVKVTRQDRVTKKTTEWTVDCTNPEQADLWVRHGDTIEVPEKTGD